MSAARGRANHSLYLAKILHRSWQQALAEQNVSPQTLQQAFLGPVCEHLRSAYGQFLLEVTGQQTDPGTTLPRSCDELPAPDPGKAVAGEIREFEQLEASGWLCDLLAPLPSVNGVPGVQAGYGDLSPAKSRDSLARDLSVTAGAHLANWEQVHAWIDELERLFARMRDSLDEY